MTFEKTPTATRFYIFSLVKHPAEIRRFKVHSLTVSNESKTYFELKKFKGLTFYPDNPNLGNETLLRFDMVSSWNKANEVKQA